MYSVCLKYNNLTRQRALHTDKSQISTQHVPDKNSSMSASVKTQLREMSRRETWGKKVFTVRGQAVV